MLPEHSFRSEKICRIRFDGNPKLRWLTWFYFRWRTWLNIKKCTEGRIRNRTVAFTTLVDHCGQLQSRKIVNINALEAHEIDEILVVKDNFWGIQARIKAALCANKLAILVMLLVLGDGDLEQPFATGNNGIFMAGRYSSEFCYFMDVDFAE